MAGFRFRFWGNANSPRRSESGPSHHNGGTRPGGGGEANLNSRQRDLDFGLGKNANSPRRSKDLPAIMVRPGLVLVLVLEVVVVVALVVVVLAVVERLI